MTQKEKELLLRDICARLPYGVKCKDDYAQIEGKLCQVGTNYDMCLLSDEYGESKWVLVSNCKPYLFPLSSMTLRQKQELDAIVRKKLYREINYHECIRQMIDFYHKYHLDYCGLIEKDLAINTTNLNIYNYE